MSAPSSPRRTRVLGVLMIVLMVAVVAIVLRLGTVDQSLVGEAARVEASLTRQVPQRTPSPVPPEPARPAAAAKPAHSVQLVRSEAPKAATAPLKSIVPLPEGPDGPVDRRGPVRSRSPRELEILSYGFETLDEDLQECLSQWKELDPAKTPEVMIGFELDSSGLTRSFVENAEDLPFGPKTCLSNAVYGIDWSHIVEAPAKVTKRFTITPRDGG